VLAATATSFSGWTFVGHPALIWRDGLPYGYASFYVLTIPFTGVLFLKRQWLIGKRYGFVTPGEMYNGYFNSEAMRILTVLVALFFSVPYLGIQLRASGVLFNILTDGMFSVNVGMWMLALLPGGSGETVLPLANLMGGKQANLVPYLIHLMKDTAPFAVGLLAICALAAMQSTGAAYMSTASGMLTRDIVKR
jgi:Na+/proline symporter